MSDQIVAITNYIIHKSGAVNKYLADQSSRVVLRFLPPYSTNDNAIERLRKQLHDHVTRNHRRRDIESLIADAQLFLEHAQPFPGRQVSTLKLAA